MLISAQESLKKRGGTSCLQQTRIWLFATNIDSIAVGNRSSGI